MGKSLTPNFSAGFAPSAPKKVRNKAAEVDYLHKNFSLLAPTVTELLTIKVETLTPSFGEGLAPSAPTMVLNNVPTEDYLQ